MHNYEVGIKTDAVRNVTANLAVFDTEIKDFQAQVTNGSVGVIRGYLANAEKVRVRGAEFDGSARSNGNLSLYGAAAYTDGKYVTFTDAPPPLEETGGPQFEDISGIAAARHLEVGGLGRRRSRRTAARSAQPRRAVLRRDRRQLPLVVLVERHLLAVSGRRRLCAAQRARRLPRGGRLDALGVVPQPAEQGLFRPAHGGARQYRPDRRPAGRSENASA